MNFGVFFTIFFEPLYVVFLIFSGCKILIIIILLLFAGLCYNILRFIIFKAGENMPLQIIRADITKLRCDAIVNAANSTLLGGGGVDGAIHRAAGKKLLDECRTLGGCNTGEAKITNGYNLPAKYVIHTVGPVWRGGNNNEKSLLESCYDNSLKLAKEYNCESVAFPLISAGVYGYPKKEAFDIAVERSAEFLKNNDMLIYIVVFDKDSFLESSKLFSDIKQFVDDTYVLENKTAPSFVFGSEFSARPSPSGRASFSKADVQPENEVPAPLFCEALPDLDKEIPVTVDESFSQMLLRKIDEKGISDSECYKKANIDRRLFSKIRSDIHYKPSKPTAIAFAIALEMNLDETKELLLKAGYALSRSFEFDIIIEYFISHKIYDIFKINEALFAFDQALLGA